MFYLTHSALSFFKIALKMCRKIASQLAHTKKESCFSRTAVIDTITCRVYGKRQHNLGLEIPCIYIFQGKKMHAKALCSLLYIEVGFDLYLVSDITSAF